MTIQPWYTPFPIWNQSVVPCPVLTVDSWHVYRFLRRQVRWSGIPIAFRIFQFVVIHTVKGFSIVNEAEVDVFLECSCFFNDPLDVGNLISGSPAFSKSSLNTGSSRFTYCCAFFYLTRWYRQNSSWAIPNPGRWCCESVALKKPANLENSAVATGLEKVTFHSNPKERQCQRMLKLLHNCTHLTC